MINHSKWHHESGCVGKAILIGERGTWQMLLDLLANVSATSSGSGIVVHLVVLGCPAGAYKL